MAARQFFRMMRACSSDQSWTTFFRSLRLRTHRCVGVKHRFGKSDLLAEPLGWPVERASLLSALARTWQNPSHLWVLSNSHDVAMGWVIGIKKCHLASQAHPQSCHETPEGPLYRVNAHGCLV